MLLFVNMARLPPRPRVEPPAPGPHPGLEDYALSGLSFAHYRGLCLHTTVVCVFTDHSVPDWAVAARRFRLVSKMVCGTQTMGTQSSASFCNALTANGYCCLAR